MENTLTVSRGAIANLPAGGNEDPLLFSAIRLGDFDLIRLLLNQVDIGIAVRRSQGLTCEAIALSIAAGLQNESLDNATALKLVNFVLGAYTSRGSPVDIVALITPDVLIATAEAGNCNVIRFLVGLSLNVGFSDSIGMSALHAAAWKGCVDTCRLLLDLGVPSTRRWPRIIQTMKLRVKSRETQRMIPEIITTMATILITMPRKS